MSHGKMTTPKSEYLNHTFHYALPTYASTRRAVHTQRQSILDPDLFGANGSDQAPQKAETKTTESNGKIYYRDKSKLLAVPKGRLRQSAQNKPVVDVNKKPVNTRMPSVSSNKENEERSDNEEDIEASDAILRCLLSEVDHEPLQVQSEEGLQTNPFLSRDHMVSQEVCRLVNLVAEEKEKSSAPIPKQKRQRESPSLQVYSGLDLGKSTDTAVVPTSSSHDSGSLFPVIIFTEEKTKNRFVKLQDYLHLLQLHFHSNEVEIPE
ncbi:unnamed protein product [Kuraishia capsulata CBS 1993]|uniref:Uncharacterized protein n=1 Tax=Kuraishia capsulata CBS 1993 TaxID=1382522 RepID=W6MGW1_9ASCO|nr:uncharacterized protein KUCA_T00000820001 [Kuraishia capsulata CBS 1993]CDK24853.1 unnamed protein product [Kuraishia capsulata CBS 1993]